MIKVIVLITVVLSIAACSSTSDISRWEGKSIGTLINYYGAPANFIKLDDGNKIVEFYVGDSHCTVSFIVNNANAVVAGKARGNKTEC